MLYGTGIQDLFRKCLVIYNYYTRIGYKYAYIVAAVINCSPPPFRSVFASEAENTGVSFYFSFAAVSRTGLIP